MRTERLTDMVALLRRHERLTAADLASRLGVSRRTVLRDLDVLSVSGVPVYAERGRHGGFSILPGYRPPTDGLTPDETTALFLPGGEAAAEAVGQGAVWRSAHRKLEASLPSDAARSVGDLSGWLLVVPDGWNEPVDAPPCTRDLAAAATRRELIDIAYRAGGPPASVRRVRPLGLVLAGRIWYLMALRDDTGEQRTYRADRIENVSATGIRFTTDVTLADAWRGARESYRERETTTVEITTDAAALRTVSYAATLMGQITDVAERDGVVLMRVEASNVHAAAGILAGLDHLAQIRSPQHVIDAVVAVSRRNLERYDATGMQISVT